MGHPYFFVTPTARYSDKERVFLLDSPPFPIIMVAELTKGRGRIPPHPPLLLGNNEKVS